MIRHLMFATKTKRFVIERLDQQSSIALKQFEDNYMKMNSGKCHLFVSGNKCEHMWTHN